MIKTRKIEKEAWNELSGILDDIVWVERQVYGKKHDNRYVPMPKLSQWKFNHEYKYLCKEQGDYYCLQTECLHEIANTVYEKILEYNKLSGIQKLLRYIK